MKKMDETELVATLTKIFGATAKGVTVGIGDDCAVIRPTKGLEQVITTDTLTESVHFSRAYAKAAEIAYKAVAVNLSDIAAMGAKPKYLLLSLSLPDDISRQWILRFAKGFANTAKKFGCSVIGGNVASGCELSITVTAIGECAVGRAVTRSGAKPGDLIYVTSTPGDSTFGLEILTGGSANPKDVKRAKRRDIKYLVGRHLMPTPRVEWGTLLARNKLATAMIDISDGVAIDLGRICEASDVGAKVTLSTFPLSPAARKIVNYRGVKGWRLVLAGGEDYELVFTVRPKQRAMMERLVVSGKIETTMIGKIVKPPAKGERVTFYDPAGAEIKLVSMGWIHQFGTRKPGR